MRAVLQRVASARVLVGGEVVGEIGRGWLVLVGVAAGDTPAHAAWLADRVRGLRAFADAAGKMNLAVGEAGGGVLVVSNFTVAVDATASRRPGFAGAAPPGVAEPLYEAVIGHLRAAGLPVAAGRFGADMRVELTNDGPVTFVVERGAPLEPGA